jgi:hypothetical protein
VLRKYVVKAIRDFCLEFVADPYLCRKEHGLHVRFYQELFRALPEAQRYFPWEGWRVCTIQKEYPTAGNLDKPRRQAWDIAVVRWPPHAIPERVPTYDYLSLDSVVEFGMNATLDHLREDVRRLCHRDANVANKFIVHLYRLSQGMSESDWSPRSRRILSLAQVREVVHDSDVDLYYGMSDATGTFESGLWRVRTDGVNPVRT